MEADFIVRRMSRSDADAVTKLWKGTVEYHASIDPRLAVREDAGRSFRRFLNRSIGASDDVIMLVAESGGRIVGFLIGVIRDQAPVFVRSRHGYIVDIYVDPAFRRKGVGRKLVEAAEEWFASRGLDHVRLRVSAANDSGIAFWKGIGFEDYFIELWREIPHAEDEDGDRTVVSDR